MLNGSVLKVVRSPANVCWHIKLNGTLLETAPTKRAADVVAANMNKVMKGWKV